MHLGFIGVGKMGGPMGADSDFTNIVRCVEEWAGVEAKGKPHG